MVRLQSILLAACAASALAPLGGPVEARAPAPRAAQDLERIAEGLDSPKPRERHAAIDALAAVGSPEAWTLVAERGLTDPNSRVADSAQLALAGATLTPDLLELLGGRAGLGSKRPLCRVRVLQALADAPGGLPVRMLERGWKDKEAAVRVAAARATERRASLGERGLEGGFEGSDADWKRFLKAVERAARRDREPAVRAAALIALAALGEQLGRGAEAAAEAIEEARGGDEPLVVAAALDLAPGAASPEELEAMLWDRKATHGVRVAAVRALEARGDRAAARLLVRRLEDVDAPLRPAAAWGVVRALQRLSGLSIGLSSERWSRWAADLPEGPVVAVERREAEDDGPRTTTLFGLTIRGDRVAFLVDMSGSMWVDHKGAPRKEAVDVELTRCLRGLPPSARFDVVPYAKHPDPWRGELVDASPKNVDRAVKTFLTCSMKGVGDLWGALELVLADPEVDTVVVLTDGAPSGGDRWNVELMGQLLGDELRLRHVDLQMVLFGPTKGLKRRWKAVVEGLGGSVVLID